MLGDPTSGRPKKKGDKENKKDKKNAEKK